jgi:hypothetical protein
VASVEWLEDVKMKKFIFALPILASYSSFVIACGLHDEEVLATGGATGGIVSFGFVGGVISTLVVIALVLSIIVYTNRRNG